jgi:hypothetical protein
VPSWRQLVEFQHCSKYAPVAGKIGATAVDHLLVQDQGSFSLVFFVTQRRNLLKKGRNGLLEVFFGGVRRMSVQKAVRRMRKIIMFPVRVFWPVVVLAEKRESLELIEQVALLIILL